MDNLTPTDIGIAPVPGRAAEAEPLALPVESPEKAAHTAAQWGLASLLVSSVSLLLAPLMILIVLALSLGRSTVEDWDTGSRVAACVLLIGALFGLGLLGLFSLAFALTGLGWARARKLPLVLHVPGAVFGFIGLFCWVLVAVAVFLTVPSIWGR